jgi:hypothetical protein
MALKMAMMTYPRNRAFKKFFIYNTFNPKGTNNI